MTDDNDKLAAVLAETWGYSAHDGMALVFEAGDMDELAFAICKIYPNRQYNEEVKEWEWIDDAELRARVIAAAPEALRLLAECGAYFGACVREAPEICKEEAAYLAKINALLAALRDAS